MRRTLILTLAFAALLGFTLPAKAQVGGQPYVGEILLVGFNFAPKGWAFCNGQILPIAQNTALFSLLGTTYGGNGVQTFALPDLRSRTPIGSGQGPGLSPYALGQTGGEETVTLTAEQMPAHTHNVFGSSTIANKATPGGNLWATQSLLQIYSATSDSGMADGSVTPAGSGQPHDNRSPYLTLNYIIALGGIFPSRN